MTREQFHNWIGNSEALNAESVSPLREVMSRFPYFQAAQMLLAKNLKNIDHIDQVDQLQRAAVIVPDRTVLYKYLHGLVRTQTEEPAPAKESAHTSIDTDDTQPDLTDRTERAAGQEANETRFPDELIPEPIIYQLETADLPEIPPTKEPEPEPDELSFTDWLARFEQNENQQRSEPAPVETAPTARSGMDLIEHFLTQSKERPKQRAEFFNPRKVAAKADEEDFTVVSETLAQIYFHQQKYELAKKAYEVLSLKYPAKSVYFAARLKEINDLINAHS